MNYKNILAVAVLIMVGVFSFMYQNPFQVVASVNSTDEYNATTTSESFNASTCKAEMASTTKVLGSVVVTLSTNAPLEIYDATTTGPHSDHATTSIAMFKTTTAGTYTFDVRAKRGICVVGASTVGVASTTITTR